jgi:pSer/pThr/pTyr-binding forkhead associated (FHA) protein
MAPMLLLRAGDRLVPLGHGPVAIGRLPECELALDGTSVSRRHARILPTAEGPLLVDRSRFGTFLNGSQLVAPVLLAPGDVILVGDHQLVVESASADFIAVTGRPAPWRRRLATWRRRYGVALIAAAVAVRRATGSLLLAAAAGTLAEAVWFYGTLLLRARRQARHEARVGGFEGRRLADLARDLLAEFRRAEAVDLLLLRPLCLYAGLRLGGVLGLFGGKVVADLLFYGPVLALWHWRGGESAPIRRGPDRERCTTASGLPLIRD